MTNTPSSHSREPVNSSPPPESIKAMPIASMRRARSSRFSLLLETSVDYTAYRTAYGRQFLQQQPKFDSLRDAETELRCVLHDEAFVSTSDDGSIAAENVALAIDWFISALVSLFDGDEPFQNPDFLRLCCMFFASPLYENNTRLVQRHLVKRTYAELNTSPGDAYEATLWLLLAFLHLITEFQSNTYPLCKDSGLFPLLQRLVLGSPERHLHVLAMSLMFEIAQAVSLSQTDIACVTDELLVFLLEYIERMRFAESDVYNNTGTKLVLALNEQFLKLDGYASIPSSSLASVHSNGFSAPHMSAPSSPRSPGGTNIHTDRLLPAIERMSIRATHARTASTIIPAAGTDKNAKAAGHMHQQQPPRNPALFALPAESHQLPRSRSMDFRSRSEDEPNALPRSDSDSSKRPSRRHGSHRELAAVPVVDDAACLVEAQPCQRPTPVVAILARRIDCCKTFTENLVFLLNRETDAATQILILHALFCILSYPGTLGILYTNDMYVLVDIIIRDLSNLSDGMQRLSQAYLCVIGSLMRNPVFLATRHRLSDIELCLVNMLRHSLVCSQASVSVPSRRGSASSSSTRHNSITSDLAISVSQTETHRGSRAVSPVSSLSSSVSEETCFPRSVEDIQSLGVLPKASRRPAPPPPPSASLRSRTSHPHTPAALPSDNGGSALRPPCHRRRAPPPPPPREARSLVTGHLDQQAAVLSGQLAGLQHALGSEAPTEACGSQRRRHRRPPPPPPTPSSSSSSPLLATRPSSRSRAPAPPPMSSAVARTQQTEHTGLRRQLSVKKSVSIYKRSAGRPAPPQPRSRNVSGAADNQNSMGSESQLVLPTVAVSSASGYAVDRRPETIVEVKGSGLDDDDDDDDDNDDSDLPSANMAGPTDSKEAGEERRTTRRLVEAALRSCHEARMLAVSRGPVH
ncbi:pre-rRNA processing [Coemansia sp. RSA 2530]|nr:pre-rRNA processing [Coemansia sp. RSA 2530]